jgi:iron complex outermembrane receptor protein
MIRTRAILLAAGVSLLALGASEAGAQTSPSPVQVAVADPAPTEPAADPQTGLGDIIVTGEKHEAPIQSTPLAITAISGGLMQERNMNQLTDFNGYVPGLSVEKNQGSERIITIRGIGYETSENPNSEPGVAFHIDGVYIAHVMALNQDLLDVDHVEVLRGPQGTVFGETSTGGAINVITKKPVIGEESGTASISYGNYNYVKATGGVNIPITDNLAFRAFAQYLSHDGYGYSTAVPGYKKYPLDDANNLGVRASLLWKPTDDFSVLLEAQHYNQDRDASLLKNIDDPDPRARVVTQDFPGKFKIHTDMVYLTMTKGLGDWAKLKSVTAYQWLDKHETLDSDKLANPNFFNNINLWQDLSKTFTEEVSLSSAGHPRLEWTTGVYFLRQRALQDIFETTNPANAAVVLPDGTGVNFQTDSPFQHTSIAGYGQATYHATDRLDLIGGLRYSYDKISAQPYQYFTVIPPRHAISRALTGKVSAEYKLTPYNMIYVTGSRGYKPAGVSFVSNLPFSEGGPEFTPPSFKKETVWAAEIGTKNDFFDKKVRLNLAGYYYWYNDFQYTVEDPVPFSGGTDNIPRAQIYGLEAEGSVLPFKGFEIDGNISLSKGKFTSHYFTIDAQTAAAVRAAEYAIVPGCNYYCPYNPAVIAAVAAARQDVHGNDVPKMPGVQGNISATYTWHALGGNVSLRGDVVYRGHFNYALFDLAEFDRVPAYTLFNAFISYEPDNKPWKVSFSATNLTNKLGIASKFADPYGAGQTNVEYVDPRQVFGTLSFKF